MLEELDHKVRYESGEAFKCSLVLPYAYDLVAKSLVWYVLQSSDGSVNFASGNTDVDQILEEELNLRTSFCHEPIGDSNVCGVQVWIGDQPHIINPVTASTHIIKKLDTTGLIDLLNGQEDERNSQIIDYVSGVDEKFSLNGPEDEQHYYAREAAEYLQNYVDEPDRFMFFLMYTLMGTGSDKPLQELMESGLPARIFGELQRNVPTKYMRKPSKWVAMVDVLVTSFKNYFSVLYQENANDPARSISDEKYAERFADPAYGGWVNNKNEVKDLMISVARFIENVGAAAVNRGAASADVMPTNEVKNARLSSLWEIAYYGRLNGNELITHKKRRIMYEAALRLGLLFSSFEAKKNFYKAVERGASHIDAFFNNHKIFEPIDEQIRLGKEWAELRRYRMDYHGEQVEVDCIVDEAPIKTFEEYLRARLAGKEYDQIKDVYRRSVIVAKINMQDRSVIYPTEDYEVAELIINSMFNDIVAKAKDLYGLDYGENFVTLGEQGVQRRLSRSDPAAPRHKYSKSNKFRQIKTYSIYIKPDYKDDECCEIAEFALWAIPSKISRDDLGYLEKKEDDKQYRFWRLGPIHSVVLPDIIYPPKSTQVTFVRSDGD